MEPITEFTDLSKKAKDIRKSIILSLTEAGSGHLGGSLGLTDVFTFLYFNEMNHDPKDPQWAERDRLILSIGHVAPVLYATLAHAGYFPVEELLTLRKLNSRLQGHPGKDHGLPGIEISSGSLGQGLSIATGIALANKMDKKSGRVFSVCGDGELQEGSIWEAAMSASHYKLDNLVAIVDRNFCQIDGPTNNVMELEPLTLKWASFGWHVITCDGNDFRELAEAFGEAQEVIKQPSVIIAHTIMGKGVHSIENDYRWHGKVPTHAQASDFISELDKSIL
jgi:transketolase